METREGDMKPQAAYDETRSITLIWLTRHGPDLQHANFAKGIHKYLSCLREAGPGMAAPKIFVNIIQSMTPNAAAALLADAFMPWHNLMSLRWQSWFEHLCDTRSKLPVDFLQREENGQSTAEYSLSIRLTHGLYGQLAKVMSEAAAERLLAQGDPELEDIFYHKGGQWDREIHEAVEGKHSRTAPETGERVRQDIAGYSHTGLYRICTEQLFLYPQ